ncbi:MAG: hypothetical protein KY451_03405 [Actinobacteria bacterium]|nr:hypothetical protein [Actinomycetota bacterium]MBW3646307.1 hypothetical protein [Actinomycetota bacterium]
MTQRTDAERVALVLLDTFPGARMTTSVRNPEAVSLRGRDPGVETSC